MRAGRLCLRTEQYWAVAGHLSGTICCSFLGGWRIFLPMEVREEVRERGISLIHMEVGDFPQQNRMCFLDVSIHPGGCAVDDGLVSAAG